ncbi:MAG: hypothetical protein HQ526_00840 [Actinobacteria bacterium]|nr:hypothetical protein [Actinomycetota bacterium]
MRRTVVVALVLGLAATAVPSAAQAASGAPSDPSGSAATQPQSPVPSPSDGAGVLDAVKQLENGASAVPQLRKIRKPAITLRVSKSSV